MTSLESAPTPPTATRNSGRKRDLTFPLLSDQDHKVAETLGAWGPKMLYGKESIGLIRSTFILDPEGEIEREFRNVRAKGHVARVTAEVGV